MQRIGAVMAFVVLAVCASTAVGTTQSVDAPRLTVGDSWTYHTNTTLAAGLALDGQVTLVLAYHGPATVDGVDADVFRMSVSGAGSAAGNVTTDFGSAPASGSWTLTGQETLESGGLTPVAHVLDLEATGKLHTNLGALNFQLSVQNTTTYRLLEDAWRFPLSVGNSSTVRSAMNFTEDFRVFGLPLPSVHSSGRVLWNVTYTLEATTAIATPAGRFDTFRIRQAFADGTYNLLFYAPATGSEARTETYNGSEKVAVTELTAYRYQALEPPRFAGLTATDWTVLAVVIGGSAVAAFVLRRKFRKPAPPAGPPLGPP